MASGTFGLLGAGDVAWLPLAAVSTLGTALASFADRREEMNQDERNGERYQGASAALSRMRERHSDVQDAIVAGHAEVLVDYVNAVQEPLAAEHAQWVDETGRAIGQAAMALEASLNGVTIVAEDPPQGATETAADEPAPKSAATGVAASS